MANVSKPAGLSPVQYLNGSPWSGQARCYFIPQADGNAYAIGDPVVMAGDADVNGVPSITLATAGATNPILGAIVGFGRYETLMANPANLDSNIVPAAKTNPYYAMVADDPNILFQIQEGGAGPALTSANVGQNANLLSGVNNGYVSQWTFNDVGTGTGATLQVRLMGLVRTIDNAYGTAAKWLCLINVHQLAKNTAGV